MTVAQFLDRLEQEVPSLRTRFAAVQERSELAELVRDVDALGSPLRDPQLAAEMYVRMVADEHAANLLHGLVDLLADIEGEREGRRPIITTSQPEDGSRIRP